MGAGLVGAGVVGAGVVGAGVVGAGVVGAGVVGAGVVGVGLVGLGVGVTHGWSQKTLCLPAPGVSSDSIVSLMWKPWLGCAV